MLEASNDDNRYEEEWKVVITTGGEYTLSKMQSRILLQAIALKEKAVVFETFVISIPFIAEMYRVKRFLKGEYQLPERTEEKEYVPIDPVKFEEFKQEVYKKIGKSI